jgi:hypothetical protein
MLAQGDSKVSNAAVSVLGFAVLHQIEFASHGGTRQPIGFHGLRKSGSGFFK